MKWVIADLNQTVSVKEQRVDGSSVGSSTVRYTLVAGKTGSSSKYENGLIRLSSNRRLKLSQ
jgi:hypothetical protein